MYNIIKKNNIKEFIKFIISAAIIIFLFTFELDYEIYTYGKPLDLNDRIMVENENEASGSFNLTYVKARPGNIPSVLLSYVIPSWDKVSTKNVRYDNESMEEETMRGKVMLEMTNNNAIISAFNLTDHNYSYVNNKYMVYYIYEEAKTNLKVGDTILSIDDTLIKDNDSFKEALNGKKENDKVLIKVIDKNNKEKTREATLVKIDDSILIGIYFVNVGEIETDIDIKFKYKNNEVGSSGGAMSALYIYNAITNEDITKGRKICGTGTIDEEGNIGEIAGVKYKLMGAVKDKADIFIAPSGENYEEAKKLIEENKYNITLIEGTTLSEVISKLKDM